MTDKPEGGPPASSCRRVLKQPAVCSAGTMFEQATDNLLSPEDNARLVPAGMAESATQAFSRRR